jgi:peptidoglycan hydrolase-like protein with peptidoglycan-binding domain
MEPVAQLFADRGYYATRLDGAPPMNKGSANIPEDHFEETRELQELLQKRGYDVGRVDGVLGLKSRVAIRDTQIKFGLPADGWPTADLLARLRAGDRRRLRGRKVGALNRIC